MEGLRDGVRDRGRVQIITIGHTTWYFLERKKKHFTEPFSIKMVKSKLPRPDTSSQGPVPVLLYRVF